MTNFDADDTLTKLNTQLNRSMILMDTQTESEISPQKNNRSITINTKIQPANPSNATPARRKSILKKTDGRKSGMNEKSLTENAKNDENLLNSSNNRISISMPRPRTIDDLVKEENLTMDSTDPTFYLDDLSDSEDIWIMDIPSTVDPKELQGQTLTFGEKSKFKVKKDRYCASNHDVKCNITCVFNTGKPESKYKSVNVKPLGVINVRRKLSSISKTEPMQIESSSVPFPENLKVRHPLFGINYEGKVKKSAMKQISKSRRRKS